MRRSWPIWFVVHRREAGLTPLLLRLRDAGMDVRDDGDVIVVTVRASSASSAQRAVRAELGRTFGWTACLRPLDPW